MSTRSIWPPAEAAQTDCETPRAHLLTHDVLPGGLAGLITGPLSEPVFIAEPVEVVRAAWSPHADEQIGALATGYQFLLQAAAAMPGFVCSGIGAYGAQRRYPFEAVRPMGMHAENFAVGLLPALAGPAVLIAVVGCTTRCFPVFWATVQPSLPSCSPSWE